jgi:hypothetical protein
MADNTGNPSGRSGRPINADKSLAIFLSEKTYRGGIHRKCGTNERYVSGGGCVHCARVIATEQREALKYQKRHEADEAATQEQFERNLNDDPAQFIEPLDNDEPMVLEESDDAEERQRQATDDLM